MEYVHFIEPDLKVKHHINRSDMKILMEERHEDTMKGRL